MSGIVRQLNAEPDHEMGFRESTLKREMGEGFDAFDRWMRGQTVAVSEDGEVIYYPHDVYRYLDGRPIVD